MDKELKDFLDKKFIQVDEKIDKKMEEAIHRFQIITEDLEEKIKQVAEGVINLNEKFDRRFRVGTISISGNFPAA
jgi:hypothetical protein